MYREASFHSCKIKTLQIRNLATEYAEIRFQQQENSEMAEGASLLATNWPGGLLEKLFELSAT